MLIYNNGRFSVGALSFELPTVSELIPVTMKYAVRDFTCLHPTIALSFRLILKKVITTLMMNFHIFWTMRLPIS